MAKFGKKYQDAAKLVEAGKAYDLAEAIEVYSKYYSLDDVVNFYLTEESGKNKCKFKRIPLYDAVEIYDNLGNPFDEIEKIRLKTELKEDMG